MRFLRLIFVLATPHHQETQRNSIDVQIDERTLYEIYLPPFKGAIDANVGSFMCS